MAMTHGKAFIKVDGKLLLTLPGAKLDLGGVERKAVIGANGVHGFTETTKPAMLECEVSLTAGYSLAQLGKITGATVTYEADTGQTYSVNNAFVTDTMQVTAADGGKVPIKLCGDPAQELGV